MTPDLSAFLAALPDIAPTPLVAGSALPALPEAPLRILLDGELALRRDGRLVAIVEGPRALDLGAFLTGGAAQEWVAETPARLLTWPASARTGILGDPAAMAAAVRLLARDVSELEDERYDATLSLDDCFTSDGVLPRPPYRFDPVEGVVLVVQTDPARLAALRPPGVRAVPGLGGRYLLLVSDLRGARVTGADADGRSFGYQEITPLLPCIVRGRPGAYVPELWPDSVMATLLGREFYGFPKRVGRIKLREDGVDLLVDRERWLRGRWTRGESLTAGRLAEEVSAALVPALPDTARHWVGRVSGRLARGGWRIPATAYVRRRAPTDELVEVPFRLDPATDIRRLDAIDVRFHPSQSVLSGDVVGGWVLTTGFGLDGHRRVRGYRT